MSLFFSFSVRVHFETFLDVLLIPVTLEKKLGMNIDHNVMHLKEMHKKSSRYSDALESNDYLRRSWGCILTRGGA